MNRYQNQTFLIKCYRWWRYKAVYKMVVGPYRVLRWLCKGAKAESFGDDFPPLSRWRTADLVYTCAISKGDMKAQHYYHTEEVLSETRPISKL